MSDPIAAPDTALEPPAALPRGYVIVIGSLAQSRQPIANALRAHHYHVEEASRASDAAAALTAVPQALIVFDVVLPSVDGWEFREAQRQFPALLALPTVVVAPVIDGDVARLLPGAIFTIYKPFEERELVAVVDHYSGALGPSPDGERTLAAPFGGS
jgi:CheY-like chemotaxis protein